MAITYEHRKIELLPSQFEFINAKEREVLFSGGYGSGKSRILCYAALRQASIPNNVVLIVRKTQVSLKKSTLETLIGNDDPIIPNGSYTHNKSESRIDINGGGTILYTGLEDALRIRSMNLGCICVDECAELTAQEYSELLYRLRLPIGSRQIYSATNPATQSHFLYDRFFTRRSKNRRVITACSLENHYLPLDYIESLKEMDGVRYRKYVNGEWCSLENGVYDNFNRDVHVINNNLVGENNLGGEYYLGVDVGYKDCTAIILVLNTGHRLEIKSEIYKNKMLMNEIKTSIADIVSRCSKNGITVIHDPSAALLGAELESMGIKVIKGNNDIKIGINRVRTKLSCFDGKPGLVIDSNCLNTIREFESYSYGDDGKEKPIDFDNHAMDAIRYVINYIDDTASNYRSPVVYLMDEDMEDRAEEEIWK